MGRDRDALESVYRLELAAGADKFRSESTAIANKAAASKNLNSGHTVQQLIGAAVACWEQVGGRLIEAHLDVRDRDPAKIADAIGKGLRDHGFFVNHARGYVGDVANGPFDEQEKRFVASLPDRVKSAALRRRAAQTRLQRAERWAENHPVVFVIIALLVVLSWVGGAATSVGKITEVAKKLSAQGSNR